MPMHAIATIYCTVARPAHENLTQNFPEKCLSILTTSFQYILFFFPVLRSQFSIKICFAGNKWLRLMQRLTETKLLFHSRWKSKSTIWWQFTKDQNVRCQSTQLVHNIISMSKWGGEKVQYYSFERCYIFSHSKTQKNCLIFYQHILRVIHSQECLNLCSSWWPHPAVVSLYYVMSEWPVIASSQFGKWNIVASQLWASAALLLLTASGSGKA